MSDSKELKFSVKMDNSGIQDLERKIRELNQLSAQAKSQADVAARAQGAGINGVPSGPGKEAFLAEDQKRRQELLRSAQRELENNQKLLQQYQAHLNLQKSISEEIKKQAEGTEKHLELQEKLNRAQQNADKAHDEYMKNQSTIGSAIKEGGAGGGVVPPGGTPTPGASPGAAPIPGQELMKSLGKVMGYIAAAVGVGSAVYDEYSSIPMKRAQQTGSATQSIVGQDLQGIGQGDVIGTMGWMSEHHKAREMANDKLSAQKKIDLAQGAVGGGLVSGGAQMLGIGDGKLWDLTAGSILNQMSKEVEKRVGGMEVGHKFAKGIEGVADNYLSAYQSKLMEDYGKNYQQMADAEVKKNPLKNLAIKNFGESYQGDLSAQRMMGMSNDEYHGAGGFKESANMAGFNSDLALQASQQIGAAGGSTRSMRGNSVLALQSQRGFDMTNSAQVLGRISGGAGSSSATDTVFKKLLEESVKAGLDKSEFREEQRKFAEITSQVLGKAGVSTAEDAEKALQGFSRFMSSNPTMQGLKGANSAYQEFQGQSAETGGRIGTMQVAGGMKNGLVGKLGLDNFNTLMEMPDEDLTSTNQQVINLAVKAGMSPQDLVDTAKKGKRETLQRSINLDPGKMKSLDTYMKSKGYEYGKMNADDAKSMQADSPDMFNTMLEAQSKTSYGSSYESPEKRNARIRGNIDSEGGGAEAGGTSAKDLVDMKLKNTTGRSEDAVVKASGVAAQAMLENFREFKKEITPASDALDLFTKRLVILAKAIQSVPDVDKPYVAERAGKLAAKMTQPQSGKPRK